MRWRVADGIFYGRAVMAHRHVLQDIADFEHTTRDRRMQMMRMGSAGRSCILGRTWERQSPDGRTADRQSGDWRSQKYIKPVGVFSYSDQKLVARTGVEPVVFALKGRRVNHYSTGPQRVAREENQALWNSSTSARIALVHGAKFICRTLDERGDRVSNFEGKHDIKSGTGFHQSPITSRQSHLFYALRSLCSSSHAIWMASNLPSFDPFGSPVNPSRAVTHLCRSV